jgi:hypothetical protein
MRERRKDGMLSYGFLLDRDVSKAVSLFPKKRAKTIADIGLPQNAPDAAVVKAAWERQLTIVTGNGDDFIREITSFLKQTKKASDGCHEVFGLAQQNLWDDSAEQGKLQREHGTNSVSMVSIGRRMTSANLVFA